MMPPHQRRLRLVAAALAGPGATPGRNQACAACPTAADPAEHKIVRVEVRAALALPPARPLLPTCWPSLSAHEGRAVLSAAVRRFASWRPRSPASGGTIPCPSSSAPTPLSRSSPTLASKACPASRTTQITRSTSTYSVLRQIHQLCTISGVFCDAFIHRSRYTAECTRHIIPILLGIFTLSELSLEYGFKMRSLPLIPRFCIRNSGNEIG